MGPARRRRRTERSGRRGAREQPENASRPSIRREYPRPRGPPWPEDPGVSGPGSVDVPAVIDVGRNVVADVHAAEQLEQLWIVGLQILRRLQPRRAVHPLVVRPEPPLRAFGPVLVRGGLGVVAVVLALGHGVLVG